MNFKLLKGKKFATENRKHKVIFQINLSWNLSRYVDLGMEVMGMWWIEVERKILDSLE